MHKQTLRFAVVAVLSLPLALPAVVYTGTNQPGAAQEFPFTVSPGATNAAFAVNGGGGAYSELRLRAGVAPMEAVYDFFAGQVGTSNAIHLELPDLVMTNYVLRVSTPLNSAAHVFTVVLTNDVAGIRTSNRPATKALVSTASGSIGSSSWQFFRVDVPTNISGWQLTLSSTNTGPNLYVQRDALPTTSSALRSSTGTSNDLLAFTASEAVPGAYYIGVQQGPGSSSYELRTELIEFATLTWDPGATHMGTAVYTSPNTNGGSYYFRITTQNTALGAWRTALNVQTGEADVYLAKGVPPSPSSNSYQSERPGSDGFVVPATAFNAGEDWYILVRAAPGAVWSLVSGEPFVTELGVIASDGTSGSGPVVMGAEGMRFFRTTAAVDQVAWRLWLNGATNTVYVKKTSVPLPGVADLTQARQMLVVPSYLVGGQSYFVGVSGVPDAVISMDSGVHGFTDLDYVGGTNLGVNGFPFTTYRVQVPGDQLAWQVSTLATSGNPNIALRRNFIPNEANNDAYSEVPGPVTDSITLVPDTLSDGTFYITVYSTNDHEYVLVSGPPVIEDVDYVDDIINTDTNRVGWSIYKVSDIGAQVGSLGWDLSLSNAAPGTRIALRRNRAPGIWNYRNPTAGSAGYYTLLSTSDFLQAPDNPADVWYVGVYNPSNALGPFTLVLRELVANLVTFDAGVAARSDVPNGKWQFFRVDVPANVVGWDARLTGVTNGVPQLVIRRERLPISLSDIGFPVTVTATNWATGNQWVAGPDWTGRNFSSDGLVDERGRIVTVGMGRPLEPGTYYLGVINSAGSTNPMSYTVLSRGIGAGMSIPVQDLDYTGGSHSNLTLAARDLAVYRVNVPSNAPSWDVKVGVSSGDALLAVARGSMPNITAAVHGSVTNTATSGRRMSKKSETGNEHFLQLPSSSTNIHSGDYYMVVVSEGQVGANANWIGAGTAAYTVTSHGATPVIDLGLLETNDLVYNGTMEGGDSALLGFSNPPDLLGFEMTLPNRTGNPWIASPTIEGWFPNPGGGSPVDQYGNEGGVNGVFSPDVITVSGPFPSERLAIKARGSGSDYADAEYTLRIRRLFAEDVAFDSGLSTVVDQTDTYQFFKILVPSNAVGWDIRVTNVTGGDPQMIVCRDALALQLTTAGWQPGKATYWPSLANWIADEDWTHRSLSATGVNEDGRILAMGMGQPLEPGTYYVGVKGGATADPMSYTLVSRGIGEGFTIPVLDLPFEQGSVTNASLSAREAAYYRVVVPEGSASWQGRLRVTSGDALLLFASNALPNVFTGTSSGLGKAMQKPGDEQFVRLAANSQFSLPPGTNYLAVVSEGQVTSDAARIGSGSCAYVIESLGPLVPIDLGTASDTALLHTNALEAGQVVAYRFEVPPGTTSVELELLDRTGNPVMVLHPSDQFPNPGAGSPAVGPGSVSSETYGNEGGWNISAGAGNANTTLITVANPVAGPHTLMIKARPISSTHTNASYVLSVRAANVTPLAFNGGSHSVTNQNGGSWRFFSFTVPSGALGWDIRVAYVSGGVAKLVLRRDALPQSLNTFAWNSPGTTTNWPGTNQWAAVSDWTARANSPEGVNEDNRILAMGMGQPLEPGNYVAGVFNSTASNSLSYTLVSRGIGNGFILPVPELAFSGGTASNASLLPREADYYRVEVPAGVRGWKVRLTSLSGELLLLSLKDRVPNVATGRSAGALAGKLMQKAGNEHFVLLPPDGETNLPGGTYFLAVAGEGLNPSSASRVGSGSSSYEITSEGEAGVLELGSVGGPDLTHPHSLQGGEAAFYRFDVPTNTLAVEMRLEGRVGNPVLVLSTNPPLPDPGGVVSGSRDAYGNDGGTKPAFLGASIITLPNPVPGTYRLAVKARASSGSIYPDAAYTLRVRHLIAPDLNFSAELNTNGLGNTASALLTDNQRAYYRVNVPADLNGKTVSGWELNVAQSSGVAAIRVRKDLLPADGAANLMPFTPAAAVMVPPYLTPGPWYVEVIGTNSTAFTLSSSNLVLRRPVWTMPGVGELPTTPGVTAPEFGDTGVDTNGVALPGDQGIDLEAGRYHYYAVEVPTNNGALFGLQLAAISGNPDLCLRALQPPTFSHRTNGASGTTLDRALIGSVTDYANWVPLNGVAESRLTPGTWYIAVRAGGSANARYRLRLSTGRVQDLDLAAGAVVNQTVASNDWRYFRFLIPADAPAFWHLTFSQESGDVVMHLRDIVPPGNGVDNGVSNVRDWGTDKKNTGPYASYDPSGTHTLSVPPLRPGNVYYVGFRAKLDSSFSFSSSVSGSNALPPEIAFYGGFVTNTVPPWGALTYRILTPEDAFRWRHTSTHASSVRLYLENGSLPVLAATDDWRSTVADSAIPSQFLTGYPWLPAQTYYLVVTNTTSTPQPFSLTMNGSSNTADDDADGMPDIWEVQYFGTLNRGPTADQDGDGVTNLDEYHDGTDPTDRNSLRPRLFVNAPNGFVEVNPMASNYTSGAAVTLTAFPNPGFGFTGWTGAVNTVSNPLALVLTSNTTLTAKFRVPADDFEQRIELWGFEVTAVPLSNVGATKEPGEPAHAGNAGGRSLWWTWMAPADDRVSVTTKGSTFRNLLAAYTGTNVNGLALVTNAAAPAGSNTVTLSINAIANTSYHFAVDGFASATGMVALAISTSNSFRLSEPVRSGVEGFRFKVLSAPGLVLRVQAAGNQSDWMTLAVITNSTGSDEFLDDALTGYPMRFYRGMVGAGPAGSTGPPVLGDARRLPDGSFQFSVLDVVSRTVRIEAGPDPRMFAPLTTLTNMTSPVIVVDTNSTGSLTRFYRAVLE